MPCARHSYSHFSRRKTEVGQHIQGLTASVWQWGGLNLQLPGILLLTAEEPTSGKHGGPPKSVPSVLTEILRARVWATFKLAKHRWC